ncbi:MAG TPA: lysylphosphatidylglycerol synthase domain-containing protein [Bacteroidia bacterium]|nr:lysylphosphatidylglycerol synthase domain-containing protein [Bacteroidia bacterium]
MSQITQINKAIIARSEAISPPRIEIASFLAMTQSLVFCYIYCTGNMVRSNHLILSRILKVAIVLLAAVMLFSVLRKFFGDEHAVEKFTSLAGKHPFWMALIALMMPLNWFLETAKWKKLVSVSETISWKEAWSGVLAGLAIGSATPNRIGEFAGRIFQLRATPLHDGISFTLMGSLAQVVVTVVAGIAGLLVTDPDQYMHSTKAYIWALIVVGAIGFGVLFFRSMTGRFAKYFEAIKKIDARMFRYVLGISALRYLVYASQFLLMLKICGVEAGVMQLFTAIAVNYMVVSIIPSVMIGELFVRGTVASGVIGGLCGNPEAAALAAVLLWILNVGFPAICGMFFIRNITFFRNSN